MKKVVTAITTTTIAFSGASALTVSADTHEVVKRDTLWGISQHHGTSVDELMKWNKLSSTLIYPGQKISTANDKVDKPKATVKTKDKKTKSKSDSATHTVVAGDTLSEIAFEYGVTYEELMEWNDLTTTLIYPGQEIKVKKVDKKTAEAPSEEKVVSEEEPDSKDKIDQTVQDKEVESEKEEVKQVDEKKDTASKSETKPTSDSKQQKSANKITESSGDTYTVEEGNTLSEIAFAHNVSFDDLMAWNNLSSTIVVPGDTLIVNGSEKQTSKDSSNSSDESKDKEVKEEPKQEESKVNEEKEEPKQEEKTEESKENETSDSNKEEKVEEEPTEEAAPEAEEPKPEAEETETESEEPEPKAEEPKQEEEQVEEVEVEVEEQEQTTESESSSETSGEAMTMEATAYTADCEGCTGITATGIDLKNDRNQKVIAVDPNVIPLGSTVKVDGYGTAIAGDTGGAIKGNIIDLHMPTTEDAMQWGRQEVKVEVLD